MTDNITPIGAARNAKRPPNRRMVLITVEDIGDGRVELGWMPVPTPKPGEARTPAMELSDQLYEYAKTITTES